MCICAYVLHTLNYWSVGFKRLSNVIWVTLLNLFFYSSVLNFIPQGMEIPNVRWCFWIWFDKDQAYSLVGGSCGL